MTGDGGAGEAVGLRDLEPAMVARMVGELPDEQLRELLRGEARRAALDEVFRRFPDFVNTGSIRNVDAVVEWLITGAGDPDRYLLLIEHGACHTTRDLDAEPRVTFELDGLDFLKLVTGNADPAVLFLSGALQLRGDQLFAVELASYFRIPTPEGDQRAASGLDPGRPDASAIARVVADAPDQQLRAAMRSPMRELILDEVFRRFPEYVDSSKLDGVAGAMEWKITGRADGRYDRYLVAIEHGEVRAGRDLDARPRATMRLDGVDFLKLVTGNASPTMSFLKGRLRLKGDLVFAAQLPRVFRIPSRRPR
jgi:putative sterol carrier protein